MCNTARGLSMFVIAAQIFVTGCSQSSPLAPDAGDTNSAPLANTEPGSEPDSATRTRTMVPERPGRVFVFAALDAACGTLPPPELAVTRKPSKGDLSYRSGQKTKIAASAGGTCKNAEASGTGVYYTAYKGASGSDSFSLTATLASGEKMTRDFTVKIAE
ncbi:MAG: hypothetical protein KDJ45_03965 [Hyphomicrobiaceae bacterium]|nr:hypothetical protein [Hyphomicrobiaceae bacterium]MCC0010845.1 hypothetical protein [Hyphomicrobiaceae bacterium]